MSVPNDDDPLKNPNERALPRRKTAVVLKDGGDKEQASIIGAGRGAQAERILELAYEYNIPVREDADLTELLAQFELDMPIPAEAVMAVAEIMSYVYKLNQAPAPLSGVFKGDDGS